MRFQNLKRWRLTAEDALATGADRPNFLTIRKDVAGNCTAAIHREYVGAEQVTRSRDYRRTTRRGPQMTIEFQVRCRLCLNCRKARATHWRYLCQNELKAAPRTWFVTLTFRPEEHYRARCAVDLRLHERGTTLSQQTLDERFRLLAAECGKEVTRYLKRLRKAGARVRYCLVAEAHKSGLPHFHMLLHEVSEQNPVRHKLLAEKWGSGFMHAELVEDESKAAYYVTKYLTKSARAKIRASEGYGSSEPSMQSLFIEPKGS